MRDIRRSFIEVHPRTRNGCLAVILIVTIIGCGFLFWAIPQVGNALAPRNVSPAALAPVDSSPELAACVQTESFGCIDPAPAALVIRLEQLSADDQAQLLTELGEGRNRSSVLATSALVATASPAPMLAGCDFDGTFEKFEPTTQWLAELNAMSPIAPTRAQFLEAHGLTTTKVQEFTPQSNAWEPSLQVIELQEDLYGKFCLKILPGYVYTIAMPDGRVEPVWSGDPAVTEVPVLWGFSARYLPAHVGKAYGLGGWLNPSDQIEFLVREHRFGRYLRNEEMSGVREDVPFFSRFGPYYVGVGNSNTDWQPPALTAIEPRDYRDAAAMLGGLARADEWTHGTSGVWVWRYSAKVAGSGTYCPANDPCWQSVYVPIHSDGYVELWDGQAGGPRKFSAGDNATLQNGQWNVDEFSYHPYGDR